MFCLLFSTIFPHIYNHQLCVNMMFGVGFQYIIVIISSVRRFDGAFLFVKIGNVFGPLLCCFTWAKTFLVLHFWDGWGAAFRAAGHPRYNVGMTTWHPCNKKFRPGQGIVFDLFDTIQIMEYVPNHWVKFTTTSLFSLTGNDGFYREVIPIYGIISGW